MQTNYSPLNYETTVCVYKPFKDLLIIYFLGSNICIDFQRHTNGFCIKSEHT